MKIRILSDLHLEFGLLDLPVVGNESEQVLVLAGDVGLAAKTWTYIPFLGEMAQRFQDVIYIMGNHEFYDTSIRRAMDKVKENIMYDIGEPNIHVINNDTVKIGDVSFVCSTLWASYDNGDAMSMYNAKLWMSDHKKIRIGPPHDPYLRKFEPQDAFQLHIEAKQFLFPAIKAEKEAGQKVVAVTHHLPSTLSIADEFKTGPHAILNGAYASNLEEDIFESKPDLMIHGHTHHSFDYELEDELYNPGHKTRIVCNPRGYVGHELNRDFDPTLIIEV